MTTDPTPDDKPRGGAAWKDRPMPTPDELMAAVEPFVRLIEKADKTEYDWQRGEYRPAEDTRQVWQAGASWEDSGEIVTYGHLRRLRDAFRAMEARHDA